MGVSTEHIPEEVTTALPSSPKTGSSNDHTTDTAHPTPQDGDVPDPVVQKHTKGRTKGRSRALQGLLEEACKYHSQYEYALPQGFLRSRSQGKKTSEEPEIESSNGKSVEHKKPRKQANVITSRANNSSSSIGKKRGNSKGKVASPKMNLPNGARLRSSMDHEEVSESGTRHVSKNQEVTFIKQDEELFDLPYDMIDVHYLRQNDLLGDKPLPSGFLTGRLHQNGVNSKKVALKSALYPEYTEEYHIDFLKDNRVYNPMSEVGKLIEYSAMVYLPAAYSDRIRRTIIPRLNKAFDDGNSEEFVESVDEYNRVLAEVPRGEVIEHLALLKKVPRSFIHDFLHIVYTRSIHPNSNRLKEYEAFSNYVYGELLPTFLSEVYAQCGMSSESVFMDLGSGVGNCVVQAALEYGCKLSFGCEIMPNASDLTEIQYEELVKRCKLFGLRLCPIEFSLRESFVNNSRVDELIPQCDVILVNNFLFDSNMNQKVERILQQVKTGCKIITLKNLRPRGYIINFNNVDSILNRLHVQRFELKEGSVSWTHRGGEYFISTVLSDVDESLFDPSMRKRNTKRPVHYSR